MKKTFAAILLALMLPASAAALTVDEDLVAIAAMPLAVAAVADLADVPTSELVDVIMTLNRANVPAPQFIEVVRYVPVALVDTTQPRFTTYLDTQYDQGLRGEQFAVAVEERYETSYGLTDVDVVRAPRLVVVDDTFLPTTVVTRFQPVRTDFNPLALIAMPLAVAAVADMADIPMGELASFVSLLNQASVPPPQFVQVVRYAPVALYDTQPQFLTYVTTQVGDGIRGPILAQSIADRLETYGFDEIDVVHPPLVQIVEQQQYLPPVVVTRLAEARNHPHGGPPGQLKKQLGLQTGAEVVHGTQRSDVRSTRTVESARVREDREPRVKVRAEKQERKAVKARENRGRGNDDRVKVRKEQSEKIRPQKVRNVERVSRPSGDRGPARVERANAKQAAPRVDRGGSKGNSGGGKGKGSGNGNGNGKGRG